MAKLIYTAITSLDGYIEDKEGRFDWAVPDAEVHSFLDELERPIGTHLYGRPVRGMKENATGDISVSGPDLAQHAFRAGLIDELHLFVFPVVVGGGKSGLPRDVRLNLELLEERRFGNGVVHMHHRPIK